MPIGAGRNACGYNAARVGDLNRGLVIEAIRHRPGIGRTHIAADSGLTPSAITQIVATLIADGLVAEGAGTGTPGRRLGQPVRGLRLIPGYAATIGLHFDHEYATAVLVDVAGNIISHHREELAVSDPERSVALLASLYRRLDQAPGRPPRLIGAGVSVMGPVDHERGVVGQSALYPAWRDFAFGARLSEAIGGEVAIAINGAAAGLGEYWFGGGHALRNYIYAFVGYGLGGALISNRRVARGVFGNAGELGHINAYPEGEPCLCGGRGCLETVVSLRGLARHMGRGSVKAFCDQVVTPDPAMTRLFRREELDLDAAGMADDARLAQWIDQAGADLGRALISVSNIVDIPDIVVSGLLPAPMLDRLIGRARAVALAGQIRTRPRPITLSRGLAPSHLVAALGAASMPLYGNLF